MITSEIVKNSIAIRPLKNFKSESKNEYFRDEMKEEIINALSKIEELKVIARTFPFVFKGISRHTDR